MSNNTSNLVTYYGSDCQRSNVRGKSISKITIHHLAMIGDCNTIQQVIQSRDVSWNYGIGNDGNIGQYVTEDRRAWSGDSISNDDEAITIVVANSEISQSYPISDAAYAALLSLCIDICIRHNIPKLVHISNDVNRSTLTLHRQFNSSVTCPGQFLMQKLGAICIHVNNALASGTVSSTSRSLPEISSYDAIADNVIVLDPKGLVNTQRFTPYVVTIDESVRHIDVTQLRNNKVSAVFLKAGQLFNALHINQHRYESPNLESQIADINEYNFPRGLIAKVRARNVQEAKEECKWLHLVVSKYPADLGVWLDCEFTNNIHINGLILDTYLTELKRWGVDNKCGLYIDRTQLAKIDWNVYQVYFYLWLVDHSDNIPDLSQVIEPTFFDV